MFPDKKDIGRHKTVVNLVQIIPPEPPWRAVQ